MRGIARLGARFRVWRLKRRAIGAAWRNDAATLAEMAAHFDGEMLLAVKAARAKSLMRDQDIAQARAGFADILGSIKQQNDETAHYVRAFCLQNLAELRGALPDAAFHAKKGRALPVAGHIRAMLHIAKPVERPMIGTAVTAMR